MTAKPLWEATRDLHHACEAHVIGEAMASGQPPKIWYKAWIQALYQIHSAVDPYVDDSIKRVAQLELDLAALEETVTPLVAATEYVATLDNPLAIDGTAYVLTGAHLMGGEIMRRRFEVHEEYPTNHLTWEDRPASLAVLQTYRTREDISEQARACFEALLKIMNEIYETYYVGPAIDQELIERYRQYPELYPDWNPEWTAENNPDVWRHDENRRKIIDSFL
jgi:heme oxygenase